MLLEPKDLAKIVYRRARKLSSPISEVIPNTVELNGKEKEFGKLLMKAEYTSYIYNIYIHNEEQIMNVLEDFMNNSKQLIEEEMAENSSF